MFDKSDDYPRRKWAQPACDEYVACLIDRLRKLERKTHPEDGPQSAKGKDLAAFDALQAAGELVNALAGWALDHQAGLALKNLEFMPLQPSGTKNHADYLKKWANVDDHAHEKSGGSIGALDPDPIVARRLLLNLLRANPGGFNSTLKHMAIEALEALNYGETQPLLAAAKTGDKRTLAARRLELRAIGLVEYRFKRGARKYAAQKQVADALGVGFNTIKSWEFRLRTEFGDLAVSNTISFARNAALNENVAQTAAYRSSEPPSSRVGHWEDQYGARALQALAEQYRKVVSGT